MTKLDFFAFMVSLLAFYQSQTFCNSMLITLSNDFESLSAYSRFVSSANINRFQTVSLFIINNSAAILDQWLRRDCDRVTWLLWRQGFQKVPFSLSTLSRRFQIYPLWRAFSKSSIFGHGRPIRIKKVAFSNLSRRSLNWPSILFAFSTSPLCIAHSAHQNTLLPMFLDLRRLVIKLANSASGGGQDVTHAIRRM